MLGVLLAAVATQTDSSLDSPSVATRRCGCVVAVVAASSLLWLRRRCCGCVVAVVAASSLLWLRRRCCGCVVAVVAASSLLWLRRRCVALPPAFRLAPHCWSTFSACPQTNNWLRPTNVGVCCNSRHNVSSSSSPTQQFNMSSNHVFHSCRLPVGRACCVADCFDMQQCANTTPLTTQHAHNLHCSCHRQRTCLCLDRLPLPPHQQSARRW